MSKVRVVLVTKRSAFSRYVEEERDPRAKALLRKGDPSVASWRPAHHEHQRTLAEVHRALEALGAQVLTVPRAHAAFDTSDAALVVSVGGDGTLLAASHNVGSVPILGVNSSRRYSVGFFCPAHRENVRRMLDEALAGTLAKIKLKRMMVAVNGRIRSRRVLNEALFCHTSPAATSRYILEWGRIREEQRSSGFWIGPAAGSTAAQRSTGGKVLPLRSSKLQLVVREPYATRGQAYRLLRVEVGPRAEIKAQSKMPDARLFLDGPYKQVAVRLGDTVSFRVSDEPLTLLGLRTRQNLI